MEDLGSAFCGAMRRTIATRRAGQKPIQEGRWTVKGGKQPRRLTCSAAQPCKSYRGHGRAADFLRASGWVEPYGLDMTVFLAAAVLIVLFSAIGHRIGVISGVVSLIGIMVGGMMAFPLAP